MNMPQTPPPWFERLNRADRRKAAKVLRHRPSNSTWEHEELESEPIDGMTCGKCRHAVRLCQCRDTDGKLIDWGLTPTITLDGERLSAGPGAVA